MVFNVTAESARRRLGTRQVDIESNRSSISTTADPLDLSKGRLQRLGGRAQVSSNREHDSTYSPIQSSLSQSLSQATRSTTRSRSLGFKQKVISNLTTRDGKNALRRGRFADDYQLITGSIDQRVAISLNSSDFDAYLQVVDQQTGRLVAQNDDISLADEGAKITFTAQAGENYIVRVTSFKPQETGQYTLTTTPNPFDNDIGYGLPNAAAAVSGAIGQTRFQAVRNTTHWNLDQINAPEVWAQGFTGQNVTVAVLDTGVDYTHPDLEKNIWVNAAEIADNGIDDDKNGFIDDIRGWNFYKDGVANDPMDLDSHGTHVAGVIAADDNGFGITGVAPDTTIMPVRVTRDFSNDSPAQADSRLAAGIRYAVANGADILNISLGNYPGEPTMQATRSALREARAAGVVAIMASGNERNFPYYAKKPIEPALFSRNNLGIAVGAIDRRRSVADFSNPAGDRRLDFFVAPGVTVRSTVPGAYYEAAGWSGTSMATPHVTGIVALMLSAKPTLTPDQIERLLIATADSSGIKSA